VSRGSLVAAPRARARGAPDADVRLSYKDADHGDGELGGGAADGHEGGAGDVGLQVQALAQL
jgi:hypothetical protein